MSVIRGTSLTGFPALVRGVGVDPDPILVSAGLRPEDVGNHDVFIPFMGHLRAIEAAARVTNLPDFGRQLALKQGIDILGPVGVAARTAATVGDAFEIAGTFFSAYAPALRISVEPLADPKRSFFEIQILLERLPPHPHTIELALGVGLRAFRMLWGSDFRPLAVHIPHDPLTAKSDYRGYFGCRPRFAESAAGFSIRTADLSRPLSQETIAHQAIVKYLETVVRPSDRGMTGPVRDLVHQLLPTGRVSLDVVASQFALHPKTLQRRLAAEGTTFAHVLDRVRMETAERYLRDTDMTLTHLARELGYAEQSVLTRSSHRWFGEGPAAHRRALRSVVVEGDV